MSWEDEAIDYLRKHRDYVARDLRLLRSGHTQVTEQGANATRRWVDRYERQLVHIDNTIDAYNGGYSNPTDG